MATAETTDMQPDAKGIGDYLKSHLREYGLLFALIAIMAFISGRLDVLDIALAYALINFIGVIAALRFFEYGDLTTLSRESVEDPNERP